MKEAIKALNVALLGLPWWKKPLLVLFYPFLLAGTCFLWRAEDKLKKSQNKVTK